jgi:hypothetical protein
VRPGPRRICYHKSSDATTKVAPLFVHADARPDSAGCAASEEHRVTLGMPLRKEERMSHWRRTSVWWTLELGLVMVVALGLGGPPQVAAQNPCEGFTGTCRGQCDAALDQGCFENPDTRQCGKREEQWEFHACPGTPPWAPVKRVFVTSTGYPGNLGGLAGADAKCQERATAAGLGGTFKAWLSAAGTGNSAAERLTHATVPYVRVDGA